MKKNICFIANYSLTGLYKTIGEKLDVNIFWITVNETIRDEYLSDVEEDHILLLRYVNKINSEKEAEGDGSDLNLRLNEIALGDRRLRLNLERGINYLSSSSKIIKTFLKKNKIDYVFGEVTWAHEILIHRIQTQVLEKFYYIPHDVRLPENKFCFFTDEFWSIPYERKNRKQIPQVNFESVLKTDNHKLATARHIANKKSVTYKLNYLIKLILPVNDPLDPTFKGLSRREKIRKNWTKPLSRLEYKLMTRLVDVTEFKDSFKVGVPLHLQPEASIDNMARYYENQYLNILNIWRTLPNNVVLFIKEHSVAKGSRKPFFYRRLQSLRNVCFVSDELSGESFMNSMDVIYTLTGTMGLEAALAGKPVITHVRNQYSFMPNVKVVSLDDMRSARFWEELTSLSVKESLKLYETFEQNCFDGEINDPTVSSTVLSGVNINNLTLGFKDVLH